MQRFSFLQQICIDAGHVSENTPYNFVEGLLASPAMNAISPVAVRNFRFQAVKSWNGTL